MCFFVLLFGPQLWAQANYLPEEDNVDIDQLMSAVIKKAKENDRLKQEHIAFLKRTTIRDLDNPNRKEEVEEQWQGKGFKSKPPCLNPNEMLTANYDFSFNGYVEIKGKRHYEVKFQPKPNLPDKGGGCERAAMRFRGTLLIDIEYLYLVKMEAEMPRNEEFSLYVGMGKIYRVKKLEMIQMMRPDLDNLVLVDRLIIQIEYRKLFSHKFEEHDFEYTNYVYIP